MSTPDGRRARLGLLLLLVLAATLVVAGCGGDGGDDVGLTWQMSPRAGLLLDGARPDQVDPDSWNVLLKVSDQRDASGADRIRRRRCSGNYRFSIDGGEPVRARGRDQCTFRVQVPELGDHTFKVVILDDGGAEIAGSDEVDATLRDLLVVSIGDSVASGEGNPVRPTLHAIRHYRDEQCHRSEVAGQAQAALALERADPHSSITFVHLACSGAKVDGGLLTPYAGIEPDGRPELAPQVSEVARLAGDREIDALLVTVGANDLGFGPIVRRCLERGPDCRRAALALGGPLLEAIVATRLRELDDRYDRLAACVGSDDDVGTCEPRSLGLEEGAGLVEDPSDVLVSEYFDPTVDRDGSTCTYPDKIGLRKIGEITRPEMEWARTNVVQPLNARVADAAERHGWTLVDGIAPGFSRHGVCADGQEWILRIGSSFAKQFDPTGSFHPNRPGHECIGHRIQVALAERLEDAGLADVPPPKGTCTGPVEGDD
jgi:hypothetical protein